MPPFSSPVAPAAPAELEFAAPAELGTMGLEPSSPQAVSSDAIGVDQSSREIVEVARKQEE